MKISTLSIVAGLGFSSVAHAEVLNGIVDNYFTGVYATAPGSHTRLPEFDSVCKSRHWYMVNTPYTVEYRINVTSGLYAAFFTYSNVEILLTTSKNPFESNTFSMRKDSDFPQKLKDIHVAKMFFNVGRNIVNNSAHIVFENTDSQMADKYQCVVSSSA